MSAAEPLPAAMEAGKSNPNRPPTDGYRQDHLAMQDLENLDPAKLTPLTPEVISRQVRVT